MKSSPYSGCKGNLESPNTYDGLNWKMAFTAKPLQVFFIEMFPEKSSIGRVSFAHCPYLLVAMETKMQKKKKKKKISSQTPYALCV